MKGSVLVTGGARRIGRAICDGLAARGWRVLVHSRDPRNPFAADFSEDGSVERLFAATIEAAPDLCAIVNNAAAFSTTTELPPKETAAMMRINSEVPILLIELLAEHLAVRGLSGSAVNLLDVRILGAVAGESSSVDMTPYAKSKLALARATLTLARRLAPAIRVNGVAPGPVLAPADAANSEKGGAILLSRRPSPTDVAETVAFMLEAESITGQILAVDSGQSLALGGQATIAFAG